MLKRFTACCIIALGLIVACGQNDHKSLLNGKWHSDIMDVAYDFDKGITVAKSFGDESKKSLKYLRNTDKGAAIQSGENIIYVTIKDDRHISIVKEGSPLHLDMEKVSD